MAFISQKIHLENGDTNYESYVNSDGDIFIHQEGDDGWYNYIIIKKDEWDDYKNFIDKQLKEYNEGE